MRQGLVVLAILAGLVLLVGCGKRESATAESPAAPTLAEQV